jgi:hypothetical protein
LGQLRIKKFFVKISICRAPSAYSTELFASVPVPQRAEEKSSLRSTLGLGVDVGPGGSSPPLLPLTALHASTANARHGTAKIIRLLLFISLSPSA